MSLSPPSLPTSLQFDWNRWSMAVGGISLLATAYSIYQLVSELDKPWTTQLVNWAAFASWATFTLHWAHSVHIISLGVFIAPAQAVGSSAMGIISFFGMQDSWEASSSEPNEKFMHLYKCAYHVATFAWAILSLTTFVVNTPLLAAITGALYFISCFTLITHGAVKGASFASWALSRQPRPPEGQAVQAG